MISGGESVKKVCILLALVFLLGLSSSAWAEEDTWIEVIRMDGISVVVLSDGPMTLGDDSAFDSDGTGAGLVLPKALTEIGEAAFEGIPAKRVEVSENVTAIGSRAFANCENLRAITIPASVEKIADDAFEGCSDVTVYGTTEEAQRIAKLYDFTFVNPYAQTEETTTETNSPAFSFLPAPVLPAVYLN